MSRHVIRWSALMIFAALFRTPSKAADAWREVAPGVLRATGMPAGHALVDGPAAILIGAPRSSDVAELKARGLAVEFALLTHHHRDSCERAGEWVKAGIAVRAGKKSEVLLSPEAVKTFWEKSMPRAIPGRWPQLFDRFWGHWNYFVHPTGIAGVTFDLEDGATIPWHGWRIEVMATPGHSREHLAFIARRGDGSGGGIAFCGDAIAARGTVWAPFTMDWHHANNDGQQAAADSLRRLATARPILLCPEHGEPIGENIEATLKTTADNLDLVARLKSYEGFSKETVGNPPNIPFLAPTQVGTPNPEGNPQPWTRLSPHLYLTGNTYALASKDGPALLVDAYALNLKERVAELKRDFGVGPIEVAAVSHAHNDHYTGVFALAESERFQVWTLDRIADVIGAPGRFRAPYVDARAVKIDRRLADGEVVSWREYRLKIHHHPGQTLFGMGIEVEVDGKRCLFTGDNFYHADQYTGSGGWSALNRGLPCGYAFTAQRILDARPDWILAEHGGAFPFNEEDFRRRVRWAKESAIAADAVSPGGSHEWDWDLHRVRVEPHIAEVREGSRLTVELVILNPSERERHFRIRIDRPGIIAPADIGIVVPAVHETRRQVELTVIDGAPAGRHVIPCEVLVDGVQDSGDPFFVMDIKTAAAGGR